MSASHLLNLRMRIAIPCMQAAYNNSSEVELDDSLNEEVSDQATQLGEHSSGTKVAIKFDDDWWQGEIVRYDSQKDLYCVLYSDGIFEDLDAIETRQGIQDHKEHMQPAVAPDVDAAGRDAAVSDSETAGSTVAVTTQAASSVTTSSQACTSATTSYTLPAEMVIAMTALTAAAERLTTAADRIITHSSEFEQQQRVIVQQQQQTHIYHLMAQQQRMHSRQQQQQRVLVSLQQQQQQQLRQQCLALIQQQQQQQGWYWRWR
jgi:aldehyde:ferredoxin oxidoreductase